MQSANAPGDPFEILAPPEQLLPIVFNSPHSGRCYPDRFMSMVRLDRNAIRRSEDCFVDDLTLGVEPETGNVIDSAR